VTPEARRVLLVRHAESEANAGRVFADVAAIPITDRGHRQARALARHLDAAPELVVASPMVRAQQTAAPLLARFPGVRCESWPVEEFVYRPPAASEEDFAAYWTDADPRARTGPQTESFADLLERVHATADRLARETARTIVLVSHRKFLAALVFVLIAGRGRPGRRRMQRYRSFDQGLRWPNAALMPTWWEGDRVFVGPFQRFDRDAE